MPTEIAIVASHGAPRVASAVIVRTIGHLRSVDFEIDTLAASLA
jgi:hypothetical protein